MKKKFIVSILIGVLLVLTALQVSAFPGTPFSGDSSGQAIDVNLELDLLTVIDAVVGIDIASHESAVSGTGTDLDPDPVTTNAEGNGVDVEVLADVGGLLPAGVEIDLVNADTSRAFGDAPDTVADSDSLASIGVPILVDASVLETEANSTATDTDAASDGSTSVSEASVTVDLVGLSLGDILTAGPITAESDTDATSAPHQVVSTGASGVEDLDVSLPLDLIPGLDAVATAGVIQANATATCDGTDVGTSSDATVYIADLVVDGNTIIGSAGLTVNVGDVVVGPIVIDDFFGNNLARITIAPELTESADASSAPAEAVAIRIEVLTNLGGIGAGTVIDIGTANAECTASPGATGPTAIGMLNGQAAASQDRVILAVMTAGLLMLGAASVVVLQKRSHERMNR